MSKIRWSGLAVVVLGLAAAIYLYNQKPAEVGKQAESAVKILQDGVATTKQTAVDQVDRLANFLGYVKKNRCIIGDQPYEVYAYKSPEIESLTCIVSRDGKSVTTLVYPNGRIL